MQKMTQNKQYDHEYKVQAIKLAREIGSAKAAAELGVPKNTMYGWMRAVREGRLDIGKGAHMRKLFSVFLWSRANRFPHCSASTNQAP